MPHKVVAGSTNTNRADAGHLAHRIHEVSGRGIRRLRLLRGLNRCSTTPAEIDSRGMPDPIKPRAHSGGTAALDAENASCGNDFHARHGFTGMRRSWRYTGHRRACGALERLEQ